MTEYKLPVEPDGPVWDTDGTKWEKKGDSWMMVPLSPRKSWGKLIADFGPLRDYPPEPAHDTQWVNERGRVFHWGGKAWTLDPAVPGQDGVISLCWGWDSLWENCGPLTEYVESEPEPLPDWLDAPAVLATCGCRGIELWQPHNEKDGMWISVSGEHALWSTLRGVIPLYPKGQEA